MSTHASFKELDCKLDGHTTSLQFYQHQVCQALQDDVHKVASTLNELKGLGGRPPACLVQAIASLADYALQPYNGTNVAATTN